LHSKIVALQYAICNAVLIDALSAHDYGNKPSNGVPINQDDRLNLKQCSGSMLIIVHMTVSWYDHITRLMTCTVVTDIAWKCCQAPFRFYMQACDQIQTWLFYRGVATAMMQTEMKS